MRIGIVGLGFMGATHLGAGQKLPDAEVTAVCSSDPAKLAGDLSQVGGNLGRETGTFDFSRLTKYTKWQELIADPNIDAVDLCLPTDLHEQVTLAALRAGKHVLVEKPMALSVESCERMLEEASRSQRILMVAHVLRFWPEYLALREFVTADRSSVKSATLRRRCAAPAWSGWLGDTARSGGAILDLLVHDIDQAIHLFGKPEAISAVGALDAAHGIDVVTANLRYPQDLAVTITGGWHHPNSFPFSMEYTVVAERGTIDFHSGLQKPTIYAASGEAEAATLHGQDGYEAELSYFVECCRTGKQPEFCLPTESAQAVHLGHQIAYARTKNGAWIEGWL